MTDAWRIPWIPRRHEPRPPVWSTVGCLLGVAMFLGGLAATLLLANLWFLVVAAGGWLVGLAALGLAARGRRRHWRRVPATCIDREVRETANMRRVAHYPRWEPRILCEYMHEGTVQMVTPKVIWTDGFLRRSSAERYLDRRITDDGRCELYVNPDDPTEAELVGQGIKDWLLFPARLRRPAG